MVKVTAKERYYGLNQAKKAFNVAQYTSILWLKLRAKSWIKRVSGFALKGKWHQRAGRKGGWASGGSGCLRWISISAPTQAHQIPAKPGPQKSALSVSWNSGKAAITAGMLFPQQQGDYENHLPRAPAPRGTSPVHTSF